MEAGPQSRLLATLRRQLPPENFLVQLSEQDRQLWAGSPVGFENTVVLGNEAGNTLNALDRVIEALSSTA